MNVQGDPSPLDRWLRLALAPGAGCPPPQAYLAAEQEHLSAAQREALERHAALCPACAAERDLARAFDAGPAEIAARGGDVDAITARLAASFGARPAPAATDGAKLLAWPAAPPARRRRALYLPLAVAALLVLALGVTLKSTYFGAPPPLGEATRSEVLRGTLVRVAGPRGEQAEVPARFDWEAVAGAASYRVTLTDVREQVLWQVSSSAAMVALPAAVGAQLEAGVVYTWRVEALDAAGQVLAVSEPVSFSVRPAPEP